MPSSGFVCVFPGWFVGLVLFVCICCLFWNKEHVPSAFGQTLQKSFHTNVNFCLSYCYFHYFCSCILFISKSFPDVCVCVQIYDYKYTAENGLQASRYCFLLPPTSPNDPIDRLTFVYFIIHLYAEIPSEIFLTILFRGLGNCKCFSFLWGIDCPLPAEEGDQPRLEALLVCNPNVHCVSKSLLLFTKKAFQLALKAFTFEGLKTKQQQQKHQKRAVWLRLGELHASG